MPTIEYDGHSFEIDDEGFLADFNNWNAKWADYASQNEDIELTDELWSVIKATTSFNRFCILCQLMSPEPSALAI